MFYQFSLAIKNRLTPSTDQCEIMN